MDRLVRTLCTWSELVRINACDDLNPAIINGKDVSVVNRIMVRLMGVVNCVSGICLRKRRIAVRWIILKKSPLIRILNP